MFIFKWCAMCDVPPWSVSGSSYVHETGACLALIHHGGNGPYQK